MTTVLLVDDEPMMRVAFRTILEAEHDLTVVGEAGDGSAAVAATQRTTPDVVVMDIRMPKMDGLEATRRITSTTGSRVLVLTTFDIDDYVFGAIRSGASGFVLKNASPEDLVAAVRAVAAGDALLSPAATRKLIDRFGTRGVEAVNRQSLDRLTERERDVFAEVTRGLTNAEISRELGIGEATVKTHVSRLLGKLGARDRIQAVIFAYESGFATSLDSDGGRGAR